VPQPRWSQTKETPLGGSEKVPSQLFNGYAEFAGALYAGMNNEPLLM
jgi:sulfoxide reductase catalytic subunit YedY